MSFGDRPNFPLPAQRLDKVDVEAISDLVEESLMRLWASLMGPSYGLLSNTVLSYDSGTNVLTIGAARLGYFYYDGGLDADGKGGVVRYDPAVGVGSTTVSLASLAAGENTGWVFFKPMWAEADEENRAYWDAIAQAKKVGLANTRVREGCLFAVNASKSFYEPFTSPVDGVAEHGWFPFLYVKGWDSGDPIIIKVNYFEAGAYDGEEYGLLFQRPPATPAAEAHAAIGEVATTGAVAIGQAGFNRRVLAQLCRMMDSDWVTTVSGGVTTAGAVGWNSAPNRGLTQLDTAVTAVTGSVASLSPEINSRGRIVWIAEVDYSGDLYFRTGGDYNRVLPLALPAVQCGSPSGRTRITFDPTFDLEDTDINIQVSLRNAIGCITYNVSSPNVLDVYTYDAAGVAAEYDCSILITGTNDYMNDLDV